MGEQWSEAERPAIITFKPDNKITRAEVVAIVNRVTDREADEDYIKKNITSLNRFTDLTDTSYWAYMDIA